MQTVLDAIRKYDRIAIAGHVNPDTDCLAGCVVLHQAMLEQGKQCCLVLDVQHVPKRLSFVLDYVPPKLARPEDLQDCDLLVVLDTAMKRRIGLPEGFDRTLLEDRRICNIDHHLGNESFGKYNWINDTAASTTQMVAEMLKALNWPINPRQATLLYAGLHTDSCGFSLDSVTTDSLRVAADLAGNHAEIGWICQMLYRNLTPEDIKLLHVVFANTTVDSSGMIAWSTVSTQELQDSGCTPNDIDEQVAIPRSIAGVKIAMLFSESKSGATRVNLRSEDAIDILPLACSLGGGGHAHAAGAIIESGLKHTVSMVISRTKEYIEKILPNNQGVLPVNVK